MSQPALSRAASVSFTKLGLTETPELNGLLMKIRNLQLFVIDEEVMMERLSQSGWGRSRPLVIELDS